MCPGAFILSSILVYLILSILIILISVSIIEILILTLISILNSNNGEKSVAATMTYRASVTSNVKFWVTPTKQAPRSAEVLTEGEENLE